ncbi:MAG: tRNA (adenosine(37)-N6)-threonylcarbamoyltransferase complex transferase subunit TsaD, partial [Bacteroidota bacterium]|nr:tRNA (adenosine(37)-N6)-threonylcarbamoyltransferase complex transferase subunit TsaD [Bacteroidota bacterium]
LQKTIIEILLDKLIKAAKEIGIKEITVAGGVSANSGLRAALVETAGKYRWKMHIPKFAFTTDNAAMIAITGHFKYLKGEFIGMDAVPFARMDIRV